MWRVTIFSVWTSTLFVVVAEDIAYHLADNRRQITPQTVQISAQTAHFVFQVVEPLVVAVEAGFDGCQIVAIATGLFEDVASDRFLALDLTFDDIYARLEVVELFPGHVRRHSHNPNCHDSNIA